MKLSRLKRSVGRVAQRIALPKRGPTVGHEERGAEWYDAHYTTYSDEYHQAYPESSYYFLWTVIADRLRRADIRRVLEIGCGSGQLAQLMLDQGVEQYVGVDFSPKAIALARKVAPGIQFEVGDARSAAIYSQYEYDAVICTEVLEHIEVDLVVVSQFPPGKRCLCSVPNFPFESHVRHFQNVEEVADRYGSYFDGLDIIALKSPTCSMDKFFLLDGVRNQHVFSGTSEDPPTSHETTVIPDEASEPAEEMGRNGKLGMVSVRRAVRAAFADWSLPPCARAERRVDRLGLPPADPGVDRVIDEAASWLGRAQDQSRSHDGGVARHFGLIDGWASSYPETTGYVIPTMLAYSRLRGDDRVRERARRMLDWLVSIQSPCGGFQGGLIDSQPVVPVTFNTGQILMGLAAGTREFGDAYRHSMHRAAEWLVETQDPDGCWRRYPTPFAEPGEKAYETHVAWGLLEAARLEGAGGGRYGDSAMANVRWALGLQRANGWFEKCCLNDERQPLSHTIGYVLRGLVEAYLFTRDSAVLEAARKTADGLLTAIRGDGFLPGRLDADWRGATSWACLTGSVQVASCWFLLYQQTGHLPYLEAGRAATSYVRRTIRVDGPPETRGGVKGSFPVHGEYGTYQYLNWACKFSIDANLLERQLGPP